MSAQPRCKECGRVSTDWVAYSHELGGEACWDCYQNAIGESQAEALRDQHAPRDGAPEVDDAPVSKDVRIIAGTAFAAVDEPGAEPLVGSNGEVLIPEGGDVMIYGDGGASKTTLGIDCACHLAAGDDWLEAPVPKPTRVGLIEAEGPRALFRRKLRRKLEQWAGSEIEDRLQVLESPWAEFRFPSTEEMASEVAEGELDVLIVGPLSRVGMDEHGTLQEVRNFMERVNEFRARTGRRLTVVLIHHENKGGAVSGAWEGAGDTLFHAVVHARGRTTLTIQKARWSSEWHKRTLELAWSDGEAFEVIEEEERDILREITEYLRENHHRTVREIAASEQGGGIGANQNTVRHLLEQNQDLFISRTGEAAKAVGRHPSATVWDLVEVNQPPIHLDSPVSAGGGGGSGESGESPVRDSPVHESPPLDRQGLTQPLIQPDSPPLSEADVARIREEGIEGR